MKLEAVMPIVLRALSLAILVGIGSLALALDGGRPLSQLEPDADEGWSGIPTDLSVERERAHLAARGPSMGLPPLDVAAARIEGTWTRPEKARDLVQHAAVMASRGRYTVVEEPDRLTGEGPLVIDVHLPGLRLGEEDGRATDVIRMEIRDTRVARAWPHAETHAEIVSRLFD